MANGRVATGFSKPYVALYNNTGNTVTYSDGMDLARGVSVSLEVESSDSNPFHTDNQASEDAGGIFTGGTLGLTVDGLKEAAAKLILGLPEADSEGWTAYGEDSEPPYVGVGFIVRYMSAGITSYVPTIVTKAKFAIPALSAETQAESIDWQTQELSASIMRDDSANHVWKYQGKEYSTEEAAYAAMVAKLA